jgi:hypothetical protein
MLLQDNKYRVAALEPQQLAKYTDFLAARRLDNCVRTVAPIDGDGEAQPTQELTLFPTSVLPTSVSWRGFIDELDQIHQTRGRADEAEKKVEELVLVTVLPKITRQHPAFALARQEGPEFAHRLSCLTIVQDATALQVEAAKVVSGAFTKPPQRPSGREGPEAESKALFMPGFIPKHKSFEERTIAFRGQTVLVQETAAKLICSNEVDKLFVPFMRFAVYLQNACDSLLMELEQWIVRTCKSHFHEDRLSLSGLYPALDWYGFAADPRSGTFDLDRVLACMPGKNQADLARYKTVRKVVDEVDKKFELLCIVMESVDAEGLQLLSHEVRTVVDDANSFLACGSVHWIISSSYSLFSGTDAQRKSQLSNKAQAAKKKLIKNGFLNEGARLVAARETISYGVQHPTEAFKMINANLAQDLEAFCTAVSADAHLGVMVAQPNPW